MNKAKKFIIENNEYFNTAVENGYDIRMSEHEIFYFMERYSEHQLRLFAKEMQNISVMDSDLTSDEYVDMWLNSLK